MAFFVHVLNYILPAIGVTLAITALSLSLGLALGLLLAVARVYGGPLARFLAVAYSRIVRSLPTLVMIFAVWVIFAMPLHLPRFLAAVAALAACTTAYQSEIFRGAIQSLGSGQMLAARSLGMSRATAIRSVILPQALRLAIPAWSNEAAIVLKDSSLAYAVGVVELLRKTQYIAAASHKQLACYLTCALVYFCLTFLTNRGLGVAERRYRLKI